MHLFPPRSNLLNRRVHTAAMRAFAAGFENVKEQRTPVDLEIQGNIPPWLSGVLYRTGPATTRIPTTQDPSKVIDIQHWFDGLALHHRFEIFPGGQRVSYRSHKGAEDLEKSIADTGKYSTISFGQRSDPCQSIFGKFMSVFHTVRGLGAGSPSSFSIAVTLTPNMPGWDSEISHLPTSPTGPRYLVAKTDAAIMQLLDPITLEPFKVVKYSDIDPRLKGPLSAAHACRDPSTGDFYNYSCNIQGRFPTYSMFKIGAKDGKVDILADIKDAPLSYIHSFAMTDKYIILTVWQAHIKHYGMSLLYNKNFVDSIETKWDPNVDTLFYVIDKKNKGVVAKYKTPPFFCFHHLNAYDDPDTGDIIIDMAIYEDNSVLNLLYLDKLRNLDAENHMLMGRARRFRLPSPAKLPSSDIQPAIVDYTYPQSQSIELPTVSPSRYHRPYRYAYGMNKMDPKLHHTFADGVIKIDMASSPDSSPGTKVWRKQGQTPAEPIFVPRPNAVEEDDGVLLCVVLDENTMKSSLVIIDAKEMKEVARAEMAGIFPIGFHGTFSNGTV